MQTTRLPLIAPSLLLAMALASCREAQMPLPPVVQAPEVAATAPDESDATPPPAGDHPLLAAVCNIESIDGHSGDALSGPVRVSENSTVSGWRALLATDGSMAPAWLRATHADGSVASVNFLAGTEDRPDVAAQLDNSGALRSGFRNVPLNSLPSGSYTLEIVFSSGDGWVRCAHARTLVVE